MCNSTKRGTQVERDMSNLVSLEMSDLNTTTQNEILQICKDDELGLDPDGFLRRIGNTIQLNPHAPVRVVSECYDLSEDLVSIIVEDVNEKIK